MATQKQWAQRLAAVALAAVVAFGAILAAKPTTAKADWVNYQGAYYYRYNNGTWAKNTWIEYKGAYYYIGSDYKALTNSWVNYKGSYYYVGNDGKALADTWVNYKGSYYYVGKDGKALADTWVNYDDSWYYLGKDGKAVSDSWVNYKGSWYYVYESGEAVAEDFIEYKGALYYFGADGKLVTGSWIEYWGAYYYAGEDGKIVTNKAFEYKGDWYYLDENGWLVCDWSILYNGKIYYFDASGKLADVQPAGDPVTVERQVILDTPSFKVTVTGLMGYIVGAGPELYLSVENKTNNDYELHVDDICVNGWQLSFGFGLDAGPGITETSIEFDKNELAQCNITKLAEIEFKLSIYDPETEEHVYTLDHVDIKTSAADTYVQTYDENGTVVFDQDGVKLVAKGYVEDEYGDKGFTLYIYNTTDHGVTVGLTDTKVNGIPLESYRFGSCLPGKHKLDDITFLGFELEEAGITDIHEITTAFEITDNDTYEVYATSPVVTLNF